MYLLGIDIGTSACKLAVFNLEGKVICSKTCEYKVYYQKKGYAEQNPVEWYQAVCAGLKSLDFDKSKLAGIGIDGQGWSCIPVDKNGNVLCNTPIWFDTRGTQECISLKKKFGFKKIFNICGNPIKPSYTTPKVLWFKNNHPNIYNNTKYFLQSNSFIAYKLTGNYSQDKSQGYAHFFYNIEKCEYDNNLAKEMGIDIEKFPKIVDCHAVVGQITEQAAKETGLPAGVPIVAGGLDAACGALGAGVYKSGQTQEQGGQAGGMSICVNECKNHEKLILGNHVVPGLWLLQGGTVGGSGTVKWFSEQFKMSFKEIDEEASKVENSDIIYLPYMAGERSPIWDENAKGIYFGLSFSTTRGHLAKATMEGVAYSLLHNLKTAEEVCVSADTLNSMGGAANSPLWMQIKADITGKTIQIPNSDTATTIGAAILAGVGVGAYKSFSEAVEKTITIKRIYIPNKSKYYEEGYKKYLSLYEKTKELM